MATAIELLREEVARELQDSVTIVGMYWQKWQRQIFILN
jgi:hypothetical protein